MACNVASTPVRACVRVSYVLTGVFSPVEVNSYDANNCPTHFLPAYKIPSLEGSYPTSRLLSYLTSRLHLYIQDKMSDPKAEHEKDHSSNDPVKKWFTRAVIFALFIVTCQWLDTIKVRPSLPHATPNRVEGSSLFFLIIISIGPVVRFRPHVPTRARKGRNSCRPITK